LCRSRYLSRKSRPDSRSILPWPPRAAPIAAPIPLIAAFRDVLAGVKREISPFTVAPTWVRSPAPLAPSVPRLARPAPPTPVVEKNALIRRKVGYERMKVWDVLTVRVSASRRLENVGYFQSATLPDGSVLRDCGAGALRDAVEKGADLDCPQVARCEPRDRHDCLGRAPRPRS
jgi:hypothetical protein